MNGIEKIKTAAPDAPAGAGTPPIKPPPPTSVGLERRQKQHLLRLITILSRAEYTVRLAREAEELARTNCHEFISYCAEDAGLDLDGGGWQFDQMQMAFVREPGEV